MKLVLLLGVVLAVAHASVLQDNFVDQMKLSKNEAFKAKIHQMRAAGKSVNLELEMAVGSGSGSGTDCYTDHVADCAEALYECSMYCDPIEAGDEWTDACGNGCGLWCINGGPADGAGCCVQDAPGGSDCWLSDGCDSACAEDDDCSGCNVCERDINRCRGECVCGYQDHVNCPQGCPKGSGEHCMKLGPKPTDKKCCGSVNNGCYQG